MPASSPRVGGESFATKARLAAAPAAAHAGRGSSAPMSPKRRCRGSAVRRRSVGSPSPGSRVQVEQPANQRVDAPIERRPPRPPVWIAPAPIDQLAVPAKQRRRAHRQTRPGASRQRPGERGEDRSIDRTEPRSPWLPAQDRQLVSEQEISSSFERSDLHSSKTAEPEGRAPDRRTTRPRQPPESGNAEAIDVRADPLSDREPRF